jgi:RNA polymerase-binding protein DksA
MSHVKYSASELKAFKKNLNLLRVHLAEGLDRIKGDTLNKSARDSSGDLSGYSLHMADQATDNYDREFLLNLASNAQENVAKIDDAIKRVDDGSYGICTMCDKKISKARLTAVPFAEFCVPCKEDEEKKARG